MVNISKPLTTGKAQEYYKSEYANSENAYYTQGGQLQGEWHGVLAAEMGLSGTVGEREYDRLVLGQDPHSGAQLIEHRDTMRTQAGAELGHRAGWDLTFQAPKTISLTALVGGDERVREAHRAAVRTALNEMEKYTQARMGGSSLPTNTARWAAATFEHDIARPVDGYPAPHLHTHVVLFNMTRDEHGHLRSLQPRELFRVQSMATAVYRSELAYRLRELGYEIERGEQNAPEIRGYSNEYREAASARRAEITREMTEKGLSGAEAAERIAHRTRSSKIVWDPEELKAAHREEAAKFGDQPSRIVAQAASSEAVLANDRRDVRAEEAVTHARNHLTERQAAFDHYELVREALKHGQGQIRLADVERMIKTKRDEGQLLPVTHYRAAAPGVRYTTPEMVRLERETLERMKAGKGKVNPLAEGTDERSLDGTFSSLNTGQREAVRRIIESQDRIVALQGGAGTGKTTSLQVVRMIAEQNGYEAKGLAPTSRATNALKQAGIFSETLQMHLQRGSDDASQSGAPRLYFLDETSLASTKQVHDFLGRIDTHDRVVLIGDTRQHQAVEAGRIFEELQQAGITTVRLDHIVRQREAPELKAVVEDLSAGKIVPAIERLDAQQRIHAVADRTQRFEAIARDYASAPESTLVVAPDNQSRRELNQAIRQALRTEGHIAEDRYTVSVLVPRQDISAADRRLAFSYCVGDVLRYSMGSEVYNIDKGSYATVRAVDADRGEITVESSTGSRLTYDPKRLSGVQVYSTEHRTFAVGDRIQFTNPWRAANVANRDLGTITRLDSQGNLAVRLDDARREVSWNLAAMKHIDHGYAVTSYSSQGTTVDRVLVQIDTSDSKTRSLVDKTLAYVALSRPRYDAQVYTDNKERLAMALNRESEKPMALSPEEVRRYRDPNQEIPMQTQNTNENDNTPNQVERDRSNPTPAPEQAPAVQHPLPAHHIENEEQRQRQVVHSIGM